jgi:YHS domain-containing protein
MFKYLASFGVALTLVAVAAVASLAQSEAPKPTKDGVALGGYCPVAYVAMNQAMKGDPQHKSVHQGRTYHFANADAKKMFDAAPAKYVPAYDGLCATAVAQGMKMQSDPQLFAIHNGRAYLFSSAGAKSEFEKDKSGVVVRADRNWPKVKQQK